MCTSLLYICAFLFPLYFFHELRKNRVSLNDIIPLGIFPELFAKSKLKYGGAFLETFL